MHKDRDKYIVITGGVGFIGSCLVRHLNDCGIDNLLLVDHLGGGEKWKNLQGKKIADIVDKSVFFEWLKGKEERIETIIHLGACTSTVERDASYLLENNYRYSVRLAQFAIERGVRFIYASSAATYGSGDIGFSDQHSTLAELRPLNMYGMSKHLFDCWLQRQGVIDRVTGLKFFNVFGPNEKHKGRMASAFVHMLPTLLNEGVIRLFKSIDPDNFPDGEQQRDFIYVKDVAAMIYAFLENGATGIYNIGSGVPHSWNSLAKALFKALKLPLSIEYIAMPVDLHGKYQNYTCADMAKTRAALGAAAQCRPFDQAVEEYLCDYLLPDHIW